MYRDFTYIDDIVEGIASAVEKCFPYEIFNLGRGETRKLGEYIETLEDNLGVKAIRENLPIQLGDIKDSSSDISKARKMLGFDPRVSISEGIRNFVQWYKEYDDRLGLGDI